MAPAQLVEVNAGHEHTPTVCDARGHRTARDYLASDAGEHRFRDGNRLRGNRWVYGQRMAEVRRPRRHHGSIRVVELGTTVSFMV